MSSYNWPESDSGIGPGPSPFGSGITVYAGVGLFPTPGDFVGEQAVDSTGVPNIYEWNGTSWVLTASGGSLTLGNLTISGGASGLNVSGGTNAVVGSGTTISQTQASAISPGFVSAADFTTFSSKQDALTFSDSIVNTAGVVSLVGDVSVPGASQYYGTDSGSTLGYFNLPASFTLTIGAFGSTPNADGLTLSGSALNMEPADALNPGGLSLFAQTLKGVKTFTDAPIMSALTASRAVLTDSSHALTTIAYTAGLTGGTLASRDVNGNSAFNNVIEGIDFESNGPSPFQIDVSSQHTITWSGSGSQRIVLPDARTISNNQSWELITTLDGTADVYLNDNSTLLFSMPMNSAVEVSVTDISTANGEWQYNFLVPMSVSWGSDGLNLNTLNLLGSTSGEISQRASAVTASYAVAWPGAQGAANSVLLNDGFGVLSWMVSDSAANASTLAARDVHANSGFNNVSTNVNLIATTGSATVMDASFGQTLYISGLSSQDIDLPDTTTITPGTSYYIYNFTNNSSNIFLSDTVSSIYAIPSQGAVKATLISNGGGTDPNGSWVTEALLVGIPTFGAQGLSFLGSLGLTGAGGGTITLSPYATSFTSYQVTMPNAQGGAGDTLVNDGSGNLSWGSSSPLSVGAFGGTPNADGLSLAGSVLSMEPADGTHPGGVSLSAQTFAGAKTFSSAPIFSSLSVSQALILDGVGAVSTIDYSTSAFPNSLMLRDSDGNVLVNNFNTSLISFAASGTLRHLTTNTPRVVIVTGGPTTQHINLPDATTLSGGFAFEFFNNSSGILSIQNDGSSLVTVIGSGGNALIICSDNSTPNGAFTVLSGIPTSILWDLASLNLPGRLNLQGATSGVLGLLASAVTTNYAISFPPAQGAAGSVLSNDGSGNLAWTALSSITGNLTDTGTDGITITGGTGAVIGTGTSISQHVADASHNGYLSSTDWSTFNSKMAPLSGLSTGGVVYATSSSAVASSAAGTSGQAVISGGTGSPTFLNVSQSGASSALLETDSHGSAFSNNFVSKLTSTAPGAGVVTFTNATSQIHQFTGASSGPLKLPDATTLSLGWSYLIEVDTSGGSGYALFDSTTGDLGVNLFPGSAALVVCNDISTAAGSWDIFPYLNKNVVSDTATFTAKVAMVGESTVSAGKSSTVTGIFNVIGKTSGLVSITAQDAAGTWNFNLPTTAGTAGQILTSGGGGSSAMTWGSAGTGTVTSVAMTVPTFLSISGSPVTTSGTLAVTLSGTALPVVNGGTGVTSVTTAPAATKFAGWDANSNLSANNLISGYATTVSAGSSTTLTVASAYQQFLTGSTFHTFVMPVTSTLVVGQSFYLVNNSLGSLNVHSSGGNSIAIMQPGDSAIVVCISTSGTGAASWSLQVVASSSGSGTVTSVAYVGDGVLQSATPSTAVTTSGNVSATLLIQSANKVLAGPTSGGASNPSFRSLVAADFVAPAAIALTSTGTTSGYVFQTSSATIFTGDTYTNNGHTYTSVAGGSGLTTIFFTGTGAPTASGTLTRASGLGDATITFSSNQALATYTPTAGLLYVKVKGVGGGAGGNGGGTSASHGGVGGVGLNTYFGAYYLIGYGGNAASSGATAGGTGGTYAATGSGTYGFGINGGQGGPSNSAMPSGLSGIGGAGGGSAWLGGGGAGAAPNSTGSNAVTNSGGGGGGGGTDGTLTIQQSGAGGGAGGYFEAIIQGNGLQSSWLYAIGTGGTGGPVGTGNESAGGNGASGQIWIEEHFQ